MEGGCTAPIGAFAQIDGDKILFEGGLFSLDGKKAITIKHQGRVCKANLIAGKAVKEILSKGGDRLMETIRQELWHDYFQLKYYLKDSKTGYLRIPLVWSKSHSLKLVQYKT